MRVIDWARGWLQAVPHPLCDPKPYSPQPYTLNPLQADKVEIHGGQANVVQTSKEVDLKLRKKVTVKKNPLQMVEDVRSAVQLTGLCESIDKAISSVLL